MSLSTFLDIAIVALLVPTIVFAWILNSRLADLRRNRDELARLIGSFNEATHRAESGIPKLRKAADDAGRALQDRVEKAQTLRDDLAFMVDRAETTLGRLETGTRAPRASGGGTNGASSAAAERRELTRALNEARGRAGRPGDTTAAGSGVPAPPPVPGRRPRGLNPAPPARDDAEEDDFFIEDERSEAERELLRALQSVR
ncbi:hypothetical protein F1188_05385 [Roseospira marina]|uniref:DUF6468 domain-containing protein n=1 Tax=Roseospira marina TaxID=140057 RepID=A0A5M6IF52_9PROT|nr:DUF6468 domain-containing protein [Roseospira marina]KAA5606762.1 hypothetical protein F1188_05385 [Roseospira marina]MBB4313816.1 hypothetical protein [Roseospira marina]MBB5086978.1 hypothetical protein [Roseospira marina]